MNERELVDCLELARSRLIALRAHWATGGSASAAKEAAHTLRELQEMLDMLQSRYGILRDVLDCTNDLVCAKELDGRYALINPRGAEMLGKTTAEVLGADDRALFTPEEAERIMAVDREVMNTGVPCTREETFDQQGVRTTLLSTTSAWYDGERNVRGVIGVTQDVTERRKSERESALDRQRMRSMAVELVLGEERLRHTLAAELHSGIGQDLALARMKLAMLRDVATDELRETVSGIEQLVERADHSLRSISFHISPPTLYDLGLVAALQWLAEDIGLTHGLEVRIEDDASPGVADGRVRVILFRAVRELLINTAEHSGVRAATVRLMGHDGRVRITVEDAGRGFDGTLTDHRGHGLLGIREQLRYVDGTLNVASTPGRGTTVTLTAPVAELLALPAN